MSDFKDKLKIFQQNNIQPPPLKPKPFRTNSDSQVKVNLAETIKVEPVKIQNLVSNNDCINNSPDVSVTEEPLRSDKASRGSESTDDNKEDDSYTLFDSIYDLPGLENFLSADISTINDCIVSEPEIITEELSKDINLQEEPSNNLSDPHICQDDNFLKPESTPESKTDVSITMAPSPKLIEEIFNTSLWRDSINYSDDFIFAHTDNVPNKTQDLTTSSQLNVEDPKKSQISGRRSIFSSIFRSKKGPKKSLDKTSLQDNSDSESVRDSYDKNKLQTKKKVEEDNKSLDHTPKKPLNAIFNRDWLNNIGDGVKKKASVMSELRKVFSHGKFKNFKKKISKNSATVNTEKEINCMNTYVEEDLYDIDSDQSINDPDILKPNHKPIQVRNTTKVFKINKNKENKANNRISDIESIYDDEEEKINDDEVPSMNNKNNIMERAKPQSIYDEDEELGEINVFNEEDKKMSSLFSNVIKETVSAIEIIYDDGNENSNKEILEVNDTKVSNYESAEEKKKYMFTNIFGKTLPKNVNNESHNGKKINQLEKNQSNSKNKVEDEKKREGNIKNDSTTLQYMYDEDEDIRKESQWDEKEEKSFQKDNALKFDNRRRKTERKLQVSNNLKNKSNILSKSHFKHSELYDKDDEIMEADLDIPPLVKEETPGRVSETKKNLIKINNEIITLDIYDEDVEIENKSIQNMKRKKKVTKITRKSKVNADKYKGNILLKIVKKSKIKNNTEDKVMEEYASDIDEEHYMKIDELQTNKNVNKTKEIKNIREIKAIERQKDKFRSAAMKNSELYDDDEEVDEIYEEDSKLSILTKGDMQNNKIRKDAKQKQMFINKSNIRDVHNRLQEVENKNMFKENVQENKSEKGSIKSEERKYKNDIEEYALEENDEIDVDIYDDDELLYNDDIAELQEVNEERPETSNSKKSQIEKSKPSFITKLNAGIKRRQRNMIINFQNTSFLGNKEKKKMITKTKPTKNKENKDDGESTLSNTLEKNSENEGEILKGIQKRNIELAKSLFKLKDPIIPLRTARAIKTVYPCDNKYMQFNVGEFLDVLEYQNDLVLVRNGVFKCGLTSLANIQLIEDRL